VQQAVDHAGPQPDPLGQGGHVGEPVLLRGTPGRTVGRGQLSHRAQQPLVGPDAGIAQPLGLLGDADDVGRRGQPAGGGERDTKVHEPSWGWGATTIDNQARLGVQVDALDASGDRVGLGQAEPRTLTTFHEIPDIGARWTLVATYGGQQVHRQTLARTALAAGNWTVTIPAGATSALERAGFQ